MKDIKATLGDIPSFGATLKGVTVTKAPDITSHEKLEGRDLPDQHPASAISGISEAIENALGEAKASGMFDGKDGIDGKDGYTPQKGIDYFDGKDGTNGKDGYTPVKGVDYFDGRNGINGKDGYTPVKGVDYFDGKDGVDGKDGKDGATGKTAYAYAQDGGYSGTEAEFSEKLAKEPLIGTMPDITPSMVAEAVREGRPVVFRNEGLKCSFTSFDILLDKYVVGEVVNTGNINGIQLICAYGNIETDAWAFDTRDLAELSDIPEIPTAIKNPNALTINGTAYDGSSAVNMNLAKEPLIGTTAEITPTQVAEAIAEGGPVVISHTDEDSTPYTFTNFVKLNRLVVGSAFSGTGAVYLHGDLRFDWWTMGKSTFAQTSDIPSKLPNPQPLVINNTPYDGSEMVVLDIGTEPLIGTTSEITPAQVMEALHIGRSVYLTMYDVPELGMVRFNHFLYSADIGAVFSTAVLKYGDELKSVEIRGQQGGSWVVYTSDIAQQSDMPTALPNPNALTVNGTAYDGSKAVEVATTSLTVAFALTDDGGVTSETDIDAVLWLLSAKRTVTARLTTKGGTYLGAGTFNLVDSAVSTKAIADVMTTEGIYRITAVSTKSDYDVDYLLYTASAGGTVIFEEATVTGDWIAVNKLAFQLDTVYDIYWNGTLYTCTSYESEASVYTGNGHLVNAKLPDTGEPFLFNNGKGAIDSMLIKASDQPSSITLMVATHGYKVGGGGVQSVNGIFPDANGNVTIEVGSGGGSSAPELVAELTIDPTKGELEQIGEFYRLTFNEELAQTVSSVLATVCSNGKNIYGVLELPTIGTSTFPVSTTSAAGVNQVAFNFADSFNSVDGADIAGFIITNEMFMFDQAMIYQILGFGASLTIKFYTIGGGSGGTSIDVTAEVGQTIVVEEVDVNGKPTKWKAADYQERTHYAISEPLTVLDDTYTIANRQYMVQNGETLPLVAGQIYTVIFDGQTYVCECKLSNYSGLAAVAIGNLFLMNSDEEHTSEPFVIVSVENVGWGIVSPDDGDHTIKVTGTIDTFVQKIPEKYYNNTTSLYVEMFPLGDKYTVSKTADEIDNAYKSGANIILKWIWSDSAEMLFPFALREVLDNGRRKYLFFGFCALTNNYQRITFRETAWGSNLLEIDVTES
ncbi:MAG: hypothetical protein J6S71_03795 [Clostridia bacterium]|nr:hypothetical protein [Clostridia bacterium]